MNLSLTLRKLLSPSRFGRLCGSPRSVSPAIECLEARIAPATLVNPTTVTFQDKNGDAVTVTISKPLFTAANVANVFTFDTGSVNGNNSTQEQLELLNITKLGSAARGIDISITAQPVAGSSGVVNVGYIDANDIDLGNVTVGGDLGRISAGDFTYSAPGLKSLTVESLGAQGLTTQLPGGNLNSLISGGVNSITVNGDIDGAAIGIGGGAKGLLGSLTVTGSIYGAATEYSGSVRTQGGITSVQVDGSIIGGGGASSGLIGTSGTLGTVVVDGSVIGGTGAFSGAILSTKAMHSVQITGDLTGGFGADSGQVGTASNLGTVTIGGSVEGGGGLLSGTILAVGNITSVKITNGLIGGNGADSGQIGSGKSVQTIAIGSSGFIMSPAMVASPLAVSFQGIEGGVGASSGTILVQGGINSVTIGGNIDGYLINEGIRPAVTTPGAGSGAISAGGNLQTVAVTGSVDFGGIFSGADIGTVTIDGSLSDGSEIDAHQNIQTVSVNVSYSSLLSPIASGLHPLANFSSGYGPGIDNSSILADDGSIGSILAGGSGYSSAYAISNASIAAGANIGSIQAQNSDGATFAITNTEVVAGGSLGNVTASSNDGTAISSSQFQAVGGIGTITGESYNSGANGVADGILNSTFRTGAGIAGINGYSLDSTNSTAGGIVNSGFDAGGNIGPINSTGLIDGSVFIAGIDLGPNFSVTGAGTFNNTSAASFGFGASKSSVAAQIGAITLDTADGALPALIEQSTFLAGVHGSGVDKTFGTKDDSVPAGSGIGAISSPGGLDTVFMESGNIGATTSGAIVNTTYISTDTAVTAGGIGPITVNATIPGSPSSYISVPSGNSTPLSHINEISSIGSTEGIYNSTFISNAGIGDINVTLDGIRAGSDNSAISASLFQAGHAFGTITVVNNVTGTAGYAYGIVNSTFNGGIGGYGGTSDMSITLTDSNADGNSAALYDTNFDASVCSCMSANMGSIYVENADTSSTAAGIVDCVFRVHGSIGSIGATMDSGSPTAPAIEGTTFSAFGSIGDINVYGAVVSDANGPSRFLAGYDIGANMTFGNQDLSAKSLALQAGQSVGNVTVTGYFMGSDIIASINPGAGYVFGSSANSNVGTGGSIGLVSIGSAVSVDGSPFTYNQPATHAIEAANFALGEGSAPTVSAFGYTSNIPVVLYADGVDSESGEVRITNLSQSEG